MADRTAQELLALLDVFYESDGPGKERVIAAFREASDPPAYAALEKGLRDNANDRARNAAMEIYVALGGRSLPHLLALLNDANEEVRTFSSVMLGSAKDSGAVPALIQALSDADMNVKHAAAEALGKIGDRRAVAPLIDALGTDMWLQFPAAIALGDIGDFRAVGPLVALLEIPGASAPAIQALGKLGDPSALEPLARFLDDDEPALREWAIEAVVETLSKNDPDTATPELSKKAEDLLMDTLKLDRPNARKNAAIALGYFRIQDAVPMLRGLLADEEMHEAARTAISRIESKSAAGAPHLQR